MRYLLINLRPLLLKWSFVYLFLVAVTCILLISPQSATSQTKPKTGQSGQYLGWPVVANTQTDHKPKPVKKYSPQVKKAKKPILQAKQKLKKSARLEAKSQGNTYARGHCTWYAKNKRPDLPGNLGNANTWYRRAKAQGIPTGLVPKVGAIGQRGMHVVYVETINTDNTITISEMNYIGLGKISTRTVPASSFKYIY